MRTKDTRNFFNVLMHGSLIDWKVLGIEPKALLLPLKSSTTVAVTPGRSLRRYEPAFLRVICLQCEAFIHGVVCLFWDATGMFFFILSKQKVSSCYWCFLTLKCRKGVLASIIFETGCYEISVFAQFYKILFL